MEPLSLQNTISEDMVQTSLEHVRRRLKSLGEEDSAFLHAEFLHHVIQSLLSLPTDMYRPSVALLTTYALQGNVPTRVIDFAAAVQIVHAAALSHQLPLMPLPTSINGHDATRDQLAVLAGDYLYAQAAYITAGLQSLSVMALLADAIKKLCQADIMRQTRAARLPSEIALFRLSAAGAATLIGADPTVVAAFARYGGALDHAYQAHTDSERECLLRAENALSDVTSTSMREQLLHLVTLILRSRQAAGRELAI